MPRKRYALEREGPRRLEVTWQNPWKNMSVRLDGQELGIIPTRQDMLAGRQFILPDGSTLEVKLVKRSIDTELHLVRDGRPVPGSYTDPLARFKLAYGIVLGITALYLGGGAVSAITHSAFLQRIGVGTNAMILGAIWAILAYFVKRRSGVALGGAAVALLTDMLLSLIVPIIGGRMPGLLGFAVRGALAFPLFDGIEALSQLREQEALEEGEGDLPAGTSRNE